MKSLLKSTTFLAAAGAVALSATSGLAQDKPQKLKIGVSGSFASWVAYAEQDSSFENAVNAHYGTINMENDSEIHFTGNTTLDNGVRIDVIIQLETDQAEANTSGNTIDESYVKLTGTFGDLRLGSTKAAGNVLANFAPTAGVLPHNADDLGDIIVNPTGTGTPDAEIGGNDGMKIVYFTPIIEGFQGGISYMPSTTNNDSPIITGGAASGTTAAEEWVDFALSYQGEFGDVSVGADGGYWFKGGSTDEEGYRFGASIGFAGFTVGGAYADVENEVDNITSATAVSDYTAYDVGISYETGPYTVALGYYHTESPLSAAAAGDDETTHFMIGGTYSVGPGVDLGANIFMAEYEDETTTASLNNEGWGIAAGIAVSF